MFFLLLYFNFLLKKITLFMIPFNPHFQVFSTIMSYVNAEPPPFQKIYETISQAIKVLEKKILAMK